MVHPVLPGLSQLAIDNTSGMRNAAIGIAIFLDCQAIMPCIRFAGDPTLLSRESFRWRTTEPLLCRLVFFALARFHLYWLDSIAQALVKSSARKMLDTAPEYVRFATARGFWLMRPKPTQGCACVQYMVTPHVTRRVCFRFARKARPMSREQSTGPIQLSLLL